MSVNFTRTDSVAFENEMKRNTSFVVSESPCNETGEQSFLFDLNVLSVNCS